MLDFVLLGILSGHCDKTEENKGHYGHSKHPS